MEVGLGRFQLSAECFYEFALIGKRADEFKTVEEAHSVSDYGSDYEDLRNIRDGEFQRNHFSCGQLTGNHGAQAGLRNLEAPTMDAEVLLLPKHLHNNRYFGTIPGVTSSGRFIHSSEP